MRKEPTTRRGPAEGATARVRAAVPARACAAAALALAVLAFAAPAAGAGDREFDAVVRHIETTYKARRVRTPFMGLARLAVRVARPDGVKSFKLATFENLSAPDPREAARLGEVLRGSLDASWRPLVRVRSRGGVEQTFVYMREEGADVKLLVVSVEPEEASVIRVRAGREALARWINDPGSLGIRLPSNWGG